MLAKYTNNNNRKKGDLPSPSTSAIAKVFKTLINSHFIKHLECNNLLSDHQYSFRKARSSGDRLSYLTHTWSSSLRSFEESFVIILDILRHLTEFGIRLCWPNFQLKAFLLPSVNMSSSLSVVVDGATSASFLVSSDVPHLHSFFSS